MKLDEAIKKENDFINRADVALSASPQLIALSNFRDESKRRVRRLSALRALSNIRIGGVGTGLIEHILGLLLDYMFAVEDIER